MIRLAAFLVVVSLYDSAFGQATAPLPDSDQTAPAKSAKTEAAPKPRIDAVTALRVVLPKVEFSDVALRDVLDQLHRDMRINLVVRWKKLQAAGLEPETPLTLSLRNVSLGEALRLVLDQVADGEELGYRVSPDRILISTLADINSEMIVRVYDVRDLTIMPVEPSLFVGYEFTYVQSIQPVVDENSVAPQPIIGRIPLGVSLNGPDFNLEDATFDTDEDDDDEEDPPPGSPGTIEELINAIVATVEPQSWNVNGGPGTIVPFNGTLVVRNSLYVHQLLAGPVAAR